MKKKTNIVPESRKYLNFGMEVKTIDTEKRTFNARFSTYDLDLVDDRIEKGAYTRTINSWRESDRVIYLLNNHKCYSVFDSLGHMVEFYDEKDGAYGDFYVDEGAEGDALLAKIASGTIHEMSIGYDVVKWEYEDLLDDAGVLLKRIRVIKELRLYEVSVVLRGANPYTGIDKTSLKSLVYEMDSKADRELLLSLKAHIDALLSIDADAEAEDEQKKGLAFIDEVKRRQLEDELLNLSLAALATSA